MNHRHFDPGPASASDLALIGRLSKDLNREGWSSLTSWPGGLRAKGLVRHTLFGVLHVKHQRAEVRRAGIRMAILRLLEQRADGLFADELCLATDHNLDAESRALLSSAGIGWRCVQNREPSLKKVSAGVGSRPLKWTGPGAPWVALGNIRGTGGRRWTGSRAGLGAGHLNVRIRFEGDGEVVLPPTFTVRALNPAYQNGILLVGVRVKLGIELQLQMFCLNRDAKPAGSRSTYEIGPMLSLSTKENARVLKDVIERVAGKQVEGRAARNVLQQALWQLTEEGKLSPEIDQAITSLPDRATATSEAA